MKITKTIFNQLLDTLAIIAVCANGHEPNEEEKIEVEKYAKKEGLTILEAWENEMNEKWEIIFD